ncbi:MAG: DUF1573 domain-containing protein [Candidatus Dojkabacteria bacterium]
MSKKNKSSSDGSIIYGVLIISVIVILGLGILFFGGDSSSNAELEMTTGAQFQADITKHDWGDIDINGGKVSQTFEFKNVGVETLNVTGIETSCMCTTASITINGESSPDYSMDHGSGRNKTWIGEVASGETASLEVEFDPLFHGPNGFGPITRTVTFVTNDASNPTVEFRLSGKVI